MADRVPPRMCTRQRSGWWTAGKGQGETAERHAPEHNIDEGAPLDGVPVHNEPVGWVHSGNGQADEYQEGQHDEERHADGRAADNSQAPIVEVGQQDRCCEEAARARPALQQPCTTSRENVPQTSSCMLKRGA